MTPAHTIVLFDGVCNLCNHSVQWIIRHDPKGQIRFASQQSEPGQALLNQQRIPQTAALADSIVVIEGDRVYLESGAALQIVRHLPGWSWLYGFRHVPKPLRDWVYRVVAKNRYRWFGKQESCMVPTPELRNRFLEGMKT
jgi:predicted DCC family thiol-disulfide oxidoreductase YuxK